VSRTGLSHPQNSPGEDQAARDQNSDRHQPQLRGRPVDEELRPAQDGRLRA
jgi:hypothetical protein